MKPITLLLISGAGALASSMLAQEQPIGVAYRSLTNQAVTPSPIALSTTPSSLDGKGPFRFPRRSFPQGFVNLQPLFNYWHSAASIAPTDRSEPAKAFGLVPRPLPAWKIVTGPVYQVQAMGWIVDARIYSSPWSNYQQRIFLLHCPTAEKAKFESLTPERDRLDSASRRYSGVASAHASAAKDYDRSYAASANIRDNLPPGLAGQASANADYYQQKASQHVDVQLAAQQAAAAASIRSGSISKQLEPLHDNTYKGHVGQPVRRPWLGSRYEVESFAMETGSSRDGLPVFDCGFFAP